MQSYFIYTAVTQNQKYKYYFFKIYNVMHNNKIFRNWIVIIHRHLTKVSAQIIQCIIFERNELSITLSTLWYNSRLPLFICPHPSWLARSVAVHWTLFPIVKKIKEKKMFIQIKYIWYYNVYIDKLKLSINYSDWNIKVTPLAEKVSMFTRQIYDTRLSLLW